MFAASSSRRGRVRNLILFLLTLGWLIFIFSNSLRDGVESGQQSKRLLRALQGLFQSFGYHGELSEHVIRKLAHFGEFAILSFLSCLDLWSHSLFTLSDPPRRICLFAAISLPFCFLSAGIDELLQHVSAGRGPRFSDVLIDTSGALCAYLFFLAFFFLLRVIRRKRKIRKQ